MAINENSILATMNPMHLLLGGVILCLLGFLCARKYRNTNDFAKSTKRYLIVMVVVDILLAAVLGIPLLLIAGLDICGFVTMALVSNYYFYHW